MFGFLKNKLKEWTSGIKDKLSSKEETKEEIEIKEEPKKPEPEEEIKKKPKREKKKKEKLATKEDIKKVEEEIHKTQEIASKIERGEETPHQAIQELEEEREKSEEFFKEPKEKKESLLGKIGKIFKRPEEETEKIEIEKIEPIQEQKPSIFSKIKSSFVYKITKEDFNFIFEDLEMLLLENNVALEVVEDIKDKLSEKLTGKEIIKKDSEDEIKKELKNILNEMLIDPDDPLEAIEFKKNKKEPFVILFFGINGTGKTTSIAKIAYLLKSRHYSAVLAAADTFRAASIEQSSEHAKRLDLPVIKHDYGADPAAVGFDAIKYAKSHNINVVLIDTAGRMHTKSNLLSEMEKICRITNPDLKLFVAESIAGNDATEQAKSFHEIINIDGSIPTKADIDEKGGTIISVSHVTHKPIFYLGTGQSYSDLKLFSKEDFIKSLGL